MSVEYTVVDGVATLTVADLAPLGAYDVDLARELGEAVVDLADSDAVKVLVLRAATADFCAEPAGVPQAPECLPAWEQAFASATGLYQSLCFCKKVTITAVAGHCAGSGSALVLCTDITVADSTAAFRSPYATHPEANFVLGALTMRLNRAKSWLVQGSTLDAAAALEAGLVNEVVAPTELTAAVARRARAATRMPLDGVTMSKMLLQSVLDGHGVGREFDMAGFYASALWGGAR